MPVEVQLLISDLIGMDQVVTGTLLPPNVRYEY
jgi:hypothetical protein